ncbi:ABC transporter substrate-binding protein [Candidatus Aalborgicola defluviihabitans]|uniref:ABC transporter substrate-binding protein n=1 Tax=Candidatus Aalborgicola defluviihabitans TaxID=3386187 RepID=UPI00390AED6E|nr:ABC transporter substrate-binding protein [Burkholderiales bacterium]
MTFSHFGRRTTTIGIAAMLAGALVACDKPAGPSASTAAAPAAPAAADKSIPTFVFGLANEPRTLDPAYVYDGDTLRILDQIYETLVQLKPGTAEVVPGLASAHTVSEDGKTYRFTLRDGVTFHDGTPFNAAAVCFNFDRLYNFKDVQQTLSLSTFWQNVFGGFATQDLPSSPKSSLYASCEASDDHTAVLNLTKPSSALIPALASRYFGIVSPAAIKEYGDSVEISGASFSFPGKFGTEHPTGTGAFKFDKWQRGDKLVLARNDTYWGNKASIQSLIFKAIPDGPARRQALESGEIDGYDAAAPQDVEALRGEGYLVVERPGYNVGYVGFQNKTPPMDNVKVRQALSHALNREALVRSQYPAGAKLATQFLTTHVPGFNPDLKSYSYDPELARKMLAEAGHPNPTIEFWYPTGVSRAYMPDPKAIMEAYKADLEKVGVNVVVKAVPWTPEYVAGLQQGKAPMYIVGRLGTYADASDFLDSLFINGRMATSPEIIAGLAAARTEVNLEKRAEQYQKISAEIMALAPGVPFVSAPTHLVFKAGTKGFVASPIAQESMASVHH